MDGVISAFLNFKREYKGGNTIESYCFQRIIFEKKPIIGDKAAVFLFLKKRKIGTFFFYSSSFFISFSFEKEGRARKSGRGLTMFCCQLRERIPLEFS